MRISAPQWWPLKREKRKVAREKRKVEIFGNGKCKIIAIFSANDGDVTSVSLSLSLSLSLSHLRHLTYNIASTSTLAYLKVCMIHTESFIKGKLLRLNQHSTAFCFDRWLGGFCTYKTKRTLLREIWHLYANRNYVLTDYVLSESVEYVSQCNLILGQKFFRVYTPWWPPRNTLCCWQQKMVHQTHGEAKTSGRQSVLVSPPEYSAIHRYNMWLESGTWERRNKITC